MSFLPDWYVGQYPDTEDALCDYFEWLTDGKVKAYTWLPPEFYALSDSGDVLEVPQPSLWVWRKPGNADPDSRSDRQLVQIAAITNKRSDSWELIGFVREMMEDKIICNLDIPRKDGSTTRFRHSEEWLGPEIRIAGIADEKFIPVTFKVSVREIRCRPDYRPIIKNL